MPGPNGEREWDVPTDKANGRISIAELHDVIRYGFRPGAALELAGYQVQFLSASRTVIVHALGSPYYVELYMMSPVSYIGYRLLWQNKGYLDETMLRQASSGIARGYNLLTEFKRTINAQLELANVYLLTGANLVLSQAHHSELLTGLALTEAMSAAGITISAASEQSDPYYDYIDDLVARFAAKLSPEQHMCYYLNLSGAELKISCTHIRYLADAAGSSISRQHQRDWYYIFNSKTGRRITVGRGISAIINYALAQLSEVSTAPINVVPVDSGQLPKGPLNYYGWVAIDLPVNAAIRSRIEYYEKSFLPKFLPASLITQIMQRRTRDHHRLLVLPLWLGEEREG